MAKNEARRQISCYLDTIDLYDLEGELGDVLIALTKLTECAYAKHSAYKVLSFKVAWSDDNAQALDLYGSREENDVEYNNRVTLPEKLKEDRRKQYEKLKREFEGK